MRTGLRTRLARLFVVVAALGVMTVAPATSAHADFCLFCYPQG